MRVLWLCNIIIPQICEKLNTNPPIGGGWLNQMADGLDAMEDVEFCVCAPYMQGKDLTYTKWGKKSHFYGFQERLSKPHIYDKVLEKKFQKILQLFQPDIVHIFGSEYPHTLAMVMAFGNPERTVIHIQGLVSVCSIHYNAFLPSRVRKGYTLRDLLKHDNIVSQEKKFEQRGIYEIEAIRNVKHVMGRTDWDKACTVFINPQIRYHNVQEMMRPEFYEGHWKLDKCEKHSIFMSQGGYPIKGLHLALEALHILAKRYSDVKLYVAGNDIIHYNGIRHLIRKTYYAKYIISLIRKWGLQERVIFTGSLNVEEMKQRLLSSHVFISSSVIENSPNSIGEAMLLGVPIVSSNVGGVSSLIKHQESGFLYQADVPYMLAYYIGEIFSDDLLAEKMSQAEQKCAVGVYDVKKIMQDLKGVYNSMIEDNI